MKLPGLAMTCCLLIPACSFAAGENPGPKKTDQPIPALLEQLTDEEFKVREAATLDLWKKGELALPELRKMAGSDNPEQAFRARDLVKKIEYSITPETNAGVMALIERYERSPTNDKIAIYRQLAQLRAWRQMLKLYAKESSEERTSLLGSVEGVAVIAARECLLAGDSKGAREFLEMAPANQSGLIALASFHRSQGSLTQEINRATKLGPEKAGSWLLALHRVEGNLSAAKKAADSSGDSRISAMMAVLQGDPLPWIRQNGNGNQEMTSPAAYVDLAIRRWEGKTYTAADLEPLTQAMAGKNRQSSWNATAALFLLAEKKLAEERLLKLSASDAFDYLDFQERPDEALKAMGFAPDKPDFKTWAAKQVPDLIKNNEAEGNHTQDPTADLLRIAVFLEKRGKGDLLAETYLPPLKDLAAKDPDAFMAFMTTLFGTAGVEQFACRLSKDWAGTDAQKWHDLLLADGGEDAIRKEWWDWMQELDPATDDEARFHAMIALFHEGPDPEGIQEKWLNRAWVAVDQAPENAKPKLVDRLFRTLLHLKKDDVKHFIKAWELLGPETRQKIITSQTPEEWQKLISNLSAAGKWQEAADIFIQLIAKYKDSRQRVRPDLYAFAAASLRRCGREREAMEYDAWAEKLALGDPASSRRISMGYNYGQDYARASRWIMRAIMESDPNTNDYLASIELYLPDMMKSKNWHQAAAMAETVAHLQACPEHIAGNPTLALRTRLQADMAHGLALLGGNRPYALATLENCHRLAPGDASLADYFFPALRTAGLMREHDAWFEDSWQYLASVIANYPDSDNLLNSAGWLAARAGRHLDDAEKILGKALTLNPRQPAFLDTMAEIQLARGKAAQALEWSDKSVNYSPQDTQIRQQNLRFKTAGLKK